MHVFSSKTCDKRSYSKRGCTTCSATWFAVGHVVPLRKIQKAFIVGAGTLDFSGKDPNAKPDEVKETERFMFLFFAQSNAPCLEGWMVDDKMSAEASSSTERGGRTRSHANGGGDAITCW